MNADEATIVLVDGTVNTLSDSSSSGTGEDEANATLCQRRSIDHQYWQPRRQRQRQRRNRFGRWPTLLSPGTISVNAIDDGIRGRTTWLALGREPDGQRRRSCAQVHNTEDATVGYVALLRRLRPSSTSEDGINAQAIIVDAVSFTRRGRRRRSARRRRSHHRRRELDRDRGHTRQWRPPASGGRWHDQRAASSDGFSTSSGSSNAGNPMATDANASIHHHWR